MIKKSSFWVLAAACLIMSCSRDPGYSPGSDDSDAMLKARPVHGPVVLLPPSGSDDTDDLLAILNDAAPGTTVQLTEGVYHLGYMEVYGFEGCLKGAGRNKTVIAPYGLIDQFEQELLNFLPAWVKFIGGDVTLSDFAFVTGDGPLVEDVDVYYNKTLITLLMVNNYNQFFNNAGHLPMKFIMKNVDFHCGYLDPALAYLNQPYNVLRPVWVGTDVLWPVENIILTSGTFNISDCSVDNAFQGFEAFSLGEDAVFTLDNCSTTDCLYGAYFTANFNSRLFITSNSFNNTMWEGVLIEDNDWGLINWVEPFRSTEYIITGNIFSPGPESSTLTFKDSWGILYPYKYKPTAVSANNNLFNLVEGSRGIQILNNRGAVIRNNRFAGASGYGVKVDGAPVFDPWTGEEIATGESHNVLILGNNFNGLESSDSHIILSELSSGCTVVGNGKDSVIDLGTDNNVVGMKKVEGGNHAGPMIRDNFRMMHIMRR